MVFIGAGSHMAHNAILPYRVNRRDLSSAFTLTTHTHHGPIWRQVPSSVHHPPAAHYPLIIFINVPTRQSHIPDLVIIIPPPGDNSLFCSLQPAEGIAAMTDDD